MSEIKDDEEEVGNSFPDFLVAHPDLVEDLLVLLEPCKLLLGLGTFEFRHFECINKCLVTQEVAFGLIKQLEDHVFSLFLDTFVLEELLDTLHALLDPSWFIDPDDDVDHLVLETFQSDFEVEHRDHEADLRWVMRVAEFGREVESEILRVVDNLLAELQPPAAAVLDDFLGKHWLE